MQIVESAIVIPLKRRPDPKGMVAFLITVLVLTVGEFIYFTIIPFFNKATNHIDFQSVIVFVFMLVIWGALITICIRQMRAPSPYIRIGHDGIFTSEGSFLIRWTDIKELSPPTRRGSHHLRFVLRNVKEISLRANIRARTFVLAGIDERTLPISIDALLTTLQERFATELHEHSITISGWEHRATNDSWSL